MSSLENFFGRGIVLVGDFYIAIPLIAIDGKGSVSIEKRKSSGSASLAVRIFRSQNDKRAVRIDIRRRRVVPTKRKACHEATCNNRTLDQSGLIFVNKSLVYKALKVRKVASIHSFNQIHACNAYRGSTESSSNTRVRTMEEGMAGVFRGSNPIRSGKRRGCRFGFRGGRAIRRDRDSIGRDIRPIGSIASGDP